MNFRNTIISEFYKLDKEIEDLFLPRNTIENYEPNDRHDNYSKIKEILKNKPHLTYNTMDTEDIMKQILLVRSSKNIYLDYGSSFLVNSFFAKNSNIYVSNFMEWIHNTFSLTTILVDIIEKENNVIYLL